MGSENLRQFQSLPAPGRAVRVLPAVRPAAHQTANHARPGTADLGWGHDFSRIPVHTRPMAAGLGPATQRLPAGHTMALLPEAGAGDGRGLAVTEAESTDDRSTAALIGGGIGAVVGGIAGFLLGGVPGAIIGGLGGAALGAGIGAALGGSPAGPSGPVPVAVRNGPAHTPIDQPDVAGMAIAITLTSSTGNDADMAAVQDSEQVSSSLNHTGSYASVPAGRSNNSGYMAGFPIPDDQHTEGKARIIDCADNHGGNGSMEREQLDTFTAPGSGVTTPTAIPNSGYLIKRIITVTGTRIVFRLQKDPHPCTVNGFTTSAGPSPSQGEDVVVRP